MDRESSSHKKIKSTKSKISNYTILLLCNTLPETLTYIYIYYTVMSQTLWLVTCGMNENYCPVQIEYKIVWHRYGSKPFFSILWCAKCHSYGQEEKFEWLWQKG